MVIRTIEQTAVLICLLMIVTCGAIYFATAYGFTYTPKENSSNDQLSRYVYKYLQIHTANVLGIPFPEYIYRVSIGAWNPENVSALADYEAIQDYMQDIEKSIFICNTKEYDFIISDAGFKFCMNKSALPMRLVAEFLIFINQYATTL